MGPQSGAVETVEELLGETPREMKISEHYCFLRLQPDWSPPFIARLLMPAMNGEVGFPDYFTASTAYPAPFQAKIPPE